MANGITISISGVRSVIRNLNEYDEKINKAIKKAMIKSALVDVETVAKQKLTRDGHIDTGRLRASIFTAHSKFEGKKEKTTHRYRDTLGNAFTDTINVDLRFFEVKVGTVVEYAVYVEALDSFMYYAYHTSKPKIMQRIQNEVRQVLR